MLCPRRILVAAALTTLAAISSATAQSPPPKPLFQIVTQNLPLPVAGQRYSVALKAIGGQLPYHWSIQDPTLLPPGLFFDAQRAVIFGRPQSNHEFSVLVQVSDSSQPALTVSKLLVAASGAPLTVTWTANPEVQSTNIVGAVKVSNGSKDTVDTTVIVVAVNETGKAFALRYERLNLPPGTESPDLKFNNNVPSGQYSVHVDAVGEVAAKNAIYRDRRQVDGLAVQ